MNLDPFERRMVGHVLNNSPTMTLKGISIVLVLILTFIYAAIDCGIF